MKQKRILLYGDMENECEKHYSLDRIHPSEMVKAGYICEEGLTQYEKLYFSIMEEKECEPVVLPVQYGGKRGWIRSRTIINGKEKNKQKKADTDNAIIITHICFSYLYLFTLNLAT